MSVIHTMPFDEESITTVNSEVSFAAAFNVPDGTFFQTTGLNVIPHSSEGVTTHPDNDFIYSSNWGAGLRGDFVLEYSWGEDVLITNEVLIAHNLIMQDLHVGLNTTFEYTLFDPVERVVTANLSVPFDPTLNWRGSPIPWGLRASNVKCIFNGGYHYFCALVMPDDWRLWTSESKDIAPNTSIVIDRVEEASSVYLFFSEDVMTTSGEILGQATPYAQTSTTLEITTGNQDTFVVRISG